MASEEIQWGTTGGQVTIKNPKYPTYRMLGNARMADGKDVIIMSLQDWDTYCY